MNVFSHCAQRSCLVYHQLLVFLLCSINGLCLLLYGLLHFTAFDALQEQLEFQSLATLLGLGSSLALAIVLIFAIADSKESISTLLKGHADQRPCLSMRLIIGALTITALGSSCSFSTNKGTKNNLQTGIVTQYQHLEPTYVSLLMNEKELHHTDIPLGEQFQLINDGISGLTVKNGKVSVGCSLQILNSAGKPLIEVADLYAGKDLLDAQEAKRLQCNISTGAPMKWDEHYKVKVHFWDKFGDGVIDNSVVIRSTDRPLAGKDFSYRN